LGAGLARGGRNVGGSVARPPSTRLQLTVAMHFGARGVGRESRESRAVGRPQLKRHPLGSPSIIGVAAELGLAPALGASRAALFASGIRPKESP
jgi:hypothetical protein